MHPGLLPARVRACPSLASALPLTISNADGLCARRRWVAAERSNRMPIALFHTALRVAGLDVESEEAECLVANMIYKGFMKGYISHEKQMVVLSNVNAFPRVADRPAPFAL